MAKEIHNTDGFMVQGWMVRELGLSGGLLYPYALVHQFSQSRAGVYFGGPRYIAAWLGCSDKTARTYLHTLAENGLVEMEDKTVNGVLFRNYRVTDTPLQKCDTPSENFRTPLQNFPIEDNKNINITPNGDNNISMTPKSPKSFNFRNALLGLGVTPEVADAWLQVRKEKKAVNTEVAFKEIAAEITKTGKTADECIRLAVVKSWRGFRASWMANEERPREDASAPAPRRKTDSSFARMMEVGRQLGIDIDGYINGK